MPPMVATVNAEIGQYSAKMKQAGAEAAGLEKEGGGALSRLGGVAKGAFQGAAASVVVIGAVAGIAISQFESTAKAASSLQRVIGGTAEDASRLRFAFGQAGLSTEAADVSMKKFTKSIETGDKSFKQYGISTKDLTGHLLPVNTTLENTANAFKKLGPGVEASALAQKLFGKSGLDMLPFLLKGKDGIAALEKESDKYGMTLSQSNLNAIKKVTMAHREMDAAVKGLMVRIGAQLFPIVTTITTFLAATMVPVIISLSQWMGAHLGPIVNDLFGKISDGAKVVLPLAAAAFGFVKDAIALFVGSFTGAGADVSHLSGGLMNSIINFGAGARGVFDTVSQFIQTAVSDVKGFVIGFLGLVGPISQSQAKFVDWGAQVYFAIQNVYHIAQQIIGFLASNWQATIAAVGAVVAAVLVPAFITWAVAATEAAVATIMAQLPMILLLAAIAALAFGVVYAYQHFQIFRDIVDGVASFLTGTVLPAFEVVAKFMVAQFQQVVAWFQTNWPLIQQTVSVVLDLVKGIIGAFIGIVIILWNTFGNNILTQVKNIWNLISGTISGVVKVIEGIITIAMAIITGNWGAAWRGIQQVLQGIWRIISSTVQFAINTVRNIISAGVNAVSALWGFAWGAIKAVFSGIWSGMVSALQGSWNTMGRIVSDIKGAFQDAFNGVKDAVSGAWNFISGIFDKITRAVGDVISKVKSIPGVGLVSGLFKATGGSVYGGQIYTVGEHGPETFVAPPGGGRIYPNGQPLPSGTGGGGGGVTIYSNPVVHISGYTSADVGDQIVAALANHTNDLTRQMRMSGV